MNLRARSNDGTRLGYLALAIVPLLGGCELVFPLDGFRASGGDAAGDDTPSRGADGSSARPLGLLCGDASCPPSPGYVCCLRNGTTESYTDGVCAMNACANDTFFACERTADCADAGVCCTGTSSYTESNCVQTPADCTNSVGTAGSLLCDPTIATGACPAGQKCYPTVGTAYPGLATCGPE